ncbi:disease resistance protein TAO1 isoform X4 [Capsella rubella]|uniref:disease resistance protein TAO1 isoform X4 n=1 Tax=Capsella rubella TaxID=81985 RepID=UPI000CD4A1D4|nr:disease resistance protein TAO1 isoform X4 [Capsella rubella]
MDSSSFFLTTIVAATIGLFTILRKLRLHQEDDEEASSPPSSLSPSSSPSSLNRIWTHHVFPSFRGEDVRRDFLSHIQMEFQRMGITPFIDNEIKRGESIGPELIRAIRGSKIAIILLSRNYASSSWCLDELVEIMKCKEELGQIVMVVFYKVDPSDVKKLTGEFGKIFRKTCAGKTKQDTGRWRQALAKVATIAGYHSRNWDNEAAMIKQISTDISNELNNSALSSDFDGLVGMRAHLKKMEPLLCLDSDEVRMIGIWGPSGIGKTTIARVAYNKFSNNFQLSVFMESIEVKYTRPCSDDYSAKLHLQQLFMSQITNQNDMKISHLGVVKDRLKDKKVLVILDGVDQSIQLEAMAKETRWFGPGSRIIITTQNRKIFRTHGINHIYKANRRLIGINFDSGTNVKKNINISEKAFQGMTNLRFLKFQGGNNTVDLPYGLEYMSQNLRLLQWPYFPMTCLPLIFNSEFLVEIELRYSKLEKLWEGIKPLPNLKWMDLSWSKNLKELPDLSTATNLLELDLRDCSSLVKLPSTIGYTKNLQKLNLCGCSSLISLPSFIGTSTNLQILNLGGCSSLVDLPSFVGNFINLRDLDLSNLASLVELPSFDGNFINLRTLNLSRLSSLVELPSFVGNAMNLESLDLSDCSSLVKLPFSIGNLQKLQYLFLTGCSSLVELPSFVGNAMNLESLDLSDCSSLVKLPFSIGNLQKLEALRLQGCSKLEFLPTDINLKYLYELDLTNCLLLKLFPEISTSLRTLKIIGTAIEEVPSSIKSWSRLTFLSMTYSVKLKECPHAFDVITDLYVNDEEIQELPPWVNEFSRLHQLVLKGCKKLVSIPQIPDSLTYITAIDCESLEEFPPWINKSSRLHQLVLKGCKKLVSLPQIPDSLTYIIAEDCESLERLDCSFPNPYISRLNFAKCFKLNQEARDLIIGARPSEFTVLPGGEVPAYFTHRTVTGGSLTINLNEKPLPISMRFKACILLVNESDDETCSHVSVTCKNSERTIYDIFTEHLYIFEVEMDVTSSELVFEFKVRRNVWETRQCNWKIGQCGVIQVSEIP